MIDRLTAAVGRAAAWTLFLAAALMVVEVVSRYGFAAPTVWSAELVTALCAVAFFLGGAEAERRGLHIRISLLYDGAPRWRRRLVDVLTLVAGAVFLAGLAWGAARQFWGGVWRFDATGWRPETTGRAWNVPLPPVVRGFFVLGIALVALQLLARSVRSLAGWPAPQADDLDHDAQPGR
jgi:TRAP-type C4-dicarboxylate transport system permease small subunit